MKTFFLAVLFITNSLAQPTSAPTLNLPLDGVNIYSNIPTDFTWSSVSGATGYDIQFDNDTPNSTSINSFSLNSNAVGAHTWRVRAKNSSGFGPYSSTRSFTIVGAPSIPTLNSPSNGANINYGVSTNFTWSTTTNATTYEIQFDDNTSYTFSSSTNNYSRSFNDLNSHTWRVRAYNPAGYSSWTSDRSFIVVLPAPSLNSPGDNATVYANNPTDFTWSSVSGATGYDIQFDNDTPNSTSINSFSLNSNAVGAHTWRVRAKNSSGTGLWSATRSFTIVVLPAPSLNSPGDNATVYANNPTDFTWSSVSGATGYDIQFDNDTPNSTSINSFSLNSNAVGAHTWRVRAKNSSGTGLWSATRSFTIVVLPAPSLNSPGDNATVYANNPTDFTWSSVSGATGYDIQFDNSTLNSTSINSFSLISDVVGNHTWKVRAKNSLGYGQWSDERTFTVELLQTRMNTIEIVPSLSGDIKQEQTLIEELNQKGIDCVFLHVYEREYSDANGLHPHEFFGVDSKNGWNTNWGNINPKVNLENNNNTGIIQIAHSKNILVFAVIACFSNIHSPDDTQEKVKIRNVIKYLVENYTFDGIVLDYVRYDDNGTEEHTSVAVTSFIESVRASNICHGLPLLAFTPMRQAKQRVDLSGLDNDMNGIMDNCFDVENKNEIKVFGQSWPEMAENLDYLIPMNYCGVDPPGVLMQWAYDDEVKLREWINGTTKFLDTAIMISGNKNCKMLGTTLTCDDNEWGITNFNTIDIIYNQSRLNGVDGLFAYRWISSDEPNLSYGEQVWDAISKYSLPLPDFPIANAHIVSGSIKPNEPFTIDASDCHDLKTLGNNLKIRWDWNDDGTWTQFGTSKIASHTFTAEGLKILRLQVKDEDELTNTRLISVLVSQNNSPGVFSLKQPLNNSTVSSLTPTLTWNESSDPDVGDVLSYSLLICNNSSFSGNGLIQINNIIGTSYTIQNSLSSGSKYYWKIKVVDNHGAETWSTETNWSFLTPGHSDHSPVLSWTNESGYESDGINPNDGLTSTKFSFRVQYSDPNGDTPQSSYPKLHIKKGGAEINNSPFAMTEANTDPFIAGRIYTYDKSDLQAGNDYKYYFEAYDANGNAAVGEATNEQDGPIVTNGELFTLKYFLSKAARKCAIGDLNNDGVNELAVGYSTSDNSFVTIYKFNESTMRLDSLWSFAFGDVAGIYPIIGDANNDGQNELLVTYEKGDAGSLVLIFKNTDINSWEFINILGFSTIRTERGVEVGDVDNDGQNEIEVAEDWYGRSLYVLEYIGNNLWQNSQLAAGNDFRSVKVADLDNDGSKELLVGTGNGDWWDWRIYKWNGSNYILNFDSPTLGWVTATAGDVDNDGQNEVIVCSEHNEGMGENNLKIYKWNGSTYDIKWSWNSGLTCLGPTIGNLLSNGKNQIAVYSGTQGGEATDSRLHVFEKTIDSYQEIWTSEIFSDPYNGDCQIGNIDSDPANELVFCHPKDGVFVYGANSSNNSTFTETKQAIVGTSTNFNDAGKGDGHKVAMIFTILAGNGNVTVTQTNNILSNAPGNVCSYYYEISKDVQITTFSVNITFQYTDADVAGYNETPSYLGIAKFNSSTNSWQWLGGVIDAANNTITVSGVSSFSTFALFRRIFGDCNGDGYVDAADLQKLGDCWHNTNSGEFQNGCDARFFNYNKNTDGNGNQIIDAADLQVFGDCWHNGSK